MSLPVSTAFAIATLLVALPIVPAFAQAEKPATKAVDPKLAKDFIQAVFFKKIDDVKKMLAANPELANAVVDNYQSPLGTACANGSLELVQLLIEKGADVNARGEFLMSPLGSAIGRNQLEVAKLLLEKGADPTKPEGDGSTLLFYAQTPAAVEWLLARKVDAKARRKNKDTALHSACMMGHKEVIEALLAAGADIEAIGNFNKPPLHVAAGSVFASDGKGVVELLLKKGAKLDATGFAGNTALHEAAFHGRIEVVKYLLGKGIAIGVKNNNGQTPLALAKFSNKKDVVAFLETKGAKE